MRVSLEHVFGALGTATLLSVIGCGAVDGLLVREDPSCDRDNYRAECTDNVAYACVLNACPDTDCTGPRCTCDESPHIVRKDCNEDNQASVVEDDGGAHCK